MLERYQFRLLFTCWVGSLFLVPSLIVFGRADVRPVKVAPADFAPFPVTVDLVGTITAGNESQLSTQVEGLVTVMEVDVGSVVESGDTVLQLDATLAEIRRGRIAEQLKAAEAAMADARRRLNEILALVDSNGVSESEVQTREAQVLIREAEVAGLQLSLREAEEILERHTVEAPFSGVISERYAQLGEWITPGTPVVQLIESRVRTFDVHAPQHLFPQISDTTRAEVYIDFLPDRVFPAEIAVIVPYKTANTRTFLIRLNVEAPPELLLPGASGKARLFIGGDHPRISIPVDGLVRQPDGSYMVYVISENDSQTTAAMRLVQVGERSGEQIEIRNGIQAGEMVIVRGNENLSPGQEVRILSPKASAP